MNSPRSISLTSARRLAISCQRLAGPRPPANSEGIMDVMGDVGYVQIDPMRIVERSHLLVLWSRLGPYDPAHLNNLLWKEKRLFEDWAQATSIVLTEDYPIFKALKRGFAEGSQPWAQKIRSWMKKNKGFSRYILDQLGKRGPMLSQDFEDKTVEDWQSTGWTSGRNIDMVLRFLWAQGRVMIAGRTGNRKLWNLTEQYLPEWVPREQLSDNEVHRRIAQKSLRALGIATSHHIRQHYIRDCCPNIDKVLYELESKGKIIQTKIEGKKQAWYIHAEDMPLLDQIAEGDWKPRTTLLSPFDNLIRDRKRTEQLFNFSYRLEVYLPKNRRKYGSYVMPILHKDHLIGRIDPKMDRKRKRLTINAIYPEPNAPRTKHAALAIAKTIKELGDFLGANEIIYGHMVPAAWKQVLRT